ncbi:TetR/AcrR family transcriptional regulator [Clostridium hydrogenum]|uniref:TetR/AcrR family transcriptional regulator n=1 Tax=Clostridium hydrogenum TaxID=2855764 RepID=UPI001F40F849|nr:TetR/AcrR family transcriptional regulator [Clostridium hydrogenum]
MYEVFERLPEEKKKKIIDICIKEFGKNGYTSASTNTIVKKADISKGTLFNYFGNKKNLFLYVLDYITDYYINYMIKEMKVNDPDFFKRVLDWSELKLKVSCKNPDVYKFFVIAYTNIPDELKADIAKRYEKLYSKGLFLALDGLDMSKFRDDVDKQKSLELILLTLNGISEKYINNEINKSKDKGLSSLDKRVDELKEYLKILEKVFYK